MSPAAARETKIDIISAEYFMMIKKTEVMDEKYRWLSCVHESGGDV